MASEFFVSSDVTFGKDAAKELPRILKEFKAKNVMVVYDAGVKMAGIAEKVLAEVEKAGVKVTVFDGVIPNPTNEVVEEAAEIAQATEFIEGKKDAYEDSIAQGGTNVSGGQKQRLSIARAIAIKPKVYVFDDSFSALDFKTDAALRKALSARTKDASVIIVAQRISTIMNADQIILLNEGRVAGMGTHKELLKNCPEYLEIAKSQLSEAELAGEEA